MNYDETISRAPHTDNCPVLVDGVQLLRRGKQSEPGDVVDVRAKRYHAFLSE